MKFTTVICAGLFLVACGMAAEKKVPNAKKAAQSPFAKVEDKPGLPRVLLIGDSISIGYTVPVRELLEGKANVHRIPVNGGPTINGLANLKAWLGTSKWDVIHFNWGLHDLKYIGPDKEKQADPEAPTSHPQVSLPDYEKNVAELVKQMQATGAKLIWCSTTPVPKDSAGRVAGDEKKYNEAAARVMQEAKVPTDDLCTHAQAKLKEIQLPANVHFTPQGYRYLAEKVVASILEQLPAK
jgi:hypothetical protein